MIGGNDLSRYLLNFNSSDWANQANAHLQQALSAGLPYSEKYNQQAINAVQDYNKLAQNQLQQGFNQAQALNMPQHIATYNALDAYQNNLGLPTAVGGSYNLALANSQSVPLPSGQSAASSTPQPVPLPVSQPVPNSGLLQPSVIPNGPHIGY